MLINTCSGAISLSKQLEEDSAQFYRELASRFQKDKDLFLAFAKENEKFYSQVQRAYYGVISDAIEGCFAFELDTADFEIKKSLPESAGYADALKQAVAMEEKILHFYNIAAEQSKHLMADVPRTFNLVAKKRKDRLDKLRSLGI